MSIINFGNRVSIDGKNIIIVKDVKGSCISINTDNNEAIEQFIHEFRSSLGEIKNELIELGQNKSINKLLLAIDNTEKGRIVLRLPSVSTLFQGRKQYLDKITHALSDHEVRIVAIVASGGTGKSALVRSWIESMSTDGLLEQKDIFSWSFYSQGSHITVTSSTEFFLSAFKFFDIENIPLDDVQKGVVLAKKFLATNTIMILDGIEPLQHSLKILDGEIKDVALRSFISSLRLGTKRDNLVIITSRQPIFELNSFQKKTALSFRLSGLQPNEGASILKDLGVIGTQNELNKATSQLQGNALAVVLLGRLLKKHFHGDIKRIDRLSILFEDSRYSRHVDRIISWHMEQWGQDSIERSFLYLLGLFDRPMDEAERIELFRFADIAQPIKELSFEEIQELRHRLEEVGLLLPEQSDQLVNGILFESGFARKWDCHPLIREFCEKNSLLLIPNDVKQAHGILFEYYQRVPHSEFPSTLKELQPLYRAVMHGAKSGNYIASWMLFKRRILRGNEYFSTYKLGAYSDDLSCLSAFFAHNWNVTIAKGLSKFNEGELLAAAAFRLMTLGRLTEALSLRQSAVELWVSQKNWELASQSNGNLVALWISLGDLRKALSVAQKGLEFANFSASLERKIRNRAHLANVFYRMGEISESLKLFEEAENLFCHEKNTDFLESFPGCWYCNVLTYNTISESSLDTLIERAVSLTQTALHEGSLTVIGRSHYSLALIEQKRGYFDRALNSINSAVSIIKKSGALQVLPELLLTRATFLIPTNKALASNDLEEAEMIIKRCGMKAFAIDALIVRAELTLADPNIENNDYHKKILPLAHNALDLIEVTGYFLRKEYAINLINKINNLSIKSQ